MNIISVEEMIEEVFKKNDHADDDFDDGKPKVIVMVGNIGLGKSTLVRKLLNTGKYAVVNKDSLIESISGGYGKYDSNLVNVYNEAELTVMRTALTAGYGVIIDRLNINKEQRSKFISVANEFKANLIAYNFGSGTEEGLDRRKKNNRGVPEAIWNDVYKKTKDSYEAPTKEEGFKKILPPPVYVSFFAYDFDGTLVNSDKDLNITSLKNNTIELLKKQYKDMSNVIIIWTCRSGDRLNQATKFLDDNNVPYDYVNENPLAGFESSNKIFAHRYYDDLSINPKDI